MTQRRWLVHDCAVSFVIAVLCFNCTRSAENILVHPVNEGDLSTPLSPTEKALFEGELITYQWGQEVGRERYQFDGERLVSQLRFPGRNIEIDVHNTHRTIRIKSLSDTEQRAVSAEAKVGEVFLETGAWQMFSIAANWVGPNETKQVRVVLPWAEQAVEGVFKVEVLSDTSRMISATVDGLLFEVSLDSNGVVRSAKVPARGVEVKRQGEQVTYAREIVIPQGVRSEPVSATNAGLMLKGELWAPKTNGGKPKVVLILPGSGPIDRDGNNRAGVRSDAYRMLAAELARKGVASVRIDKRGVGESDNQFDPSTMTIFDLVNDAAAWYNHLQSDDRFSEVVVLGHSEGGEVALLLAQKLAIKHLVLVATAGRTHAEILREQMSLRLPASDMNQVEQAIEKVRQSKPLESIPVPLRDYLRAESINFVRSDLDLDPVELIKKVSSRVTILQGDADLQIRPKDARLLAAAKPAARVVLIHGMNHVLKQEYGVWLQQSSYTDPWRPLADGLVQAIYDSL